MHTWVVGTDESDYGRHAVLKAAHMARDGDHLILISVVHEDSVVAGGMMFPPTIIPTDPEEIISAKNHLILMSRAAEEINSTLNVDWKVYKGEARDVLETVAEKEKANVLVVGTRGRGRVKRMFLGSTADFLIHHAHCTVMVVRPNEVDQEEMEARFKDLQAKSEQGESSAGAEGGESSS